MHKNKKVALCKDNVIIKVIEKAILPFGATKIKDSENLDITQWLDERKIPEKRIGYSSLQSAVEKHECDLNDIQTINYGLSLTDNYWFYSLNIPYIVIITLLKFNLLDNKIPKYEDINFFDKKLERGFIEKLSYKKDFDKDDILTPDVTTNGKNIKYWVERNNKKYLVKQNNAIQNYTVEKELISAFIAFLLNECRVEGKKKPVPLAEYQFEKGEIESLNCCFCELFTSKELDFVSYKSLTNNLSFDNKFAELKHIIKTYSESVNNLQDYFDFLIILDFLTENHRDATDVGLLYDNQCGIFKQTAPLFGNCNGFNYMIKDFTRANHGLYSSSHKNLFNMTEEEQCDYIAREIKWFMPEMFFRKSDLILEYLGCEDMSAIPLQYRENMADWIKYKIVMIVNRRRHILLQEEAAKDDSSANEQPNYHPEQYDY